MLVFYCCMWVLSSPDIVMFPRYIMLSSPDTGCVHFATNVEGGRIEKTSLSMKTSFFIFKCIFLQNSCIFILTDVVSTCSNCSLYGLRHNFLCTTFLTAQFSMCFNQLGSVSTGTLLKYLTQSWQLAPQ